jgi:hypothetical protein
VGVLDGTVKLKSDVPVPVIEDGLKFQLTPLGRPVCESVTGESNPPVAVTVTTAYPCVPRFIDPELGETERLKLPATAVVTVRVTVVVCVVLPLVPVTVIV